MDQIKIGRFIAECRKKKGLTQMQLAEMLNITDRAVSKWETGRTMPDSSIMIELCDILEISVNELLCGEVIAMDNYKEELENNLLEMVKQKEAADRTLLALEWVIGILSCVVIFVPVFIGALLPMEDWMRLVVVFSGFIPGIIGFLYAVKIEQVAGYYECGHCKHTYVPTYRSVSFAQHRGRTRYMRCPKCNKKSWQKKVLSKNK
ncbi:MAG: helix-turn-helix transcriptional regulator [Clostridia bacterium]|nr:helix-turn-helix transcriptional regulator [Clostridia bacterium]